MKKPSFLNKFVLIAGLLLASQGFAMDSWIAHKSSTSPTKTDGCYQIYTPAELAWFAHKVNSINDATSGDYCAEVRADLDMAGYYWIPISSKGTRRAVDFNGNSFIIKNLYISAEEILNDNPNNTELAQNLGLIGAFIGHVQYVILENVEVYAYGKKFKSKNSDAVKSPLSIGTVVGWQSDPNSKVENCYVTGKMVTSGDGQAVGGIVGNNGGGTIKNCYSAVDIDANGTAYVGGIAGYTKAYTGGAVATISSCVYAGNTLSSTGSGAVGAIVGNHYDGTTAFENVYYDSDNFGGSVGRTMAGDTTGTTTGTTELNSELVACTLNGGVIEYGVCTEESPWSAGASSICLDGYGADGYKITFNANGGSFAGGTTFVKYVKAGNIINNDGVADPTWANDGYVFAGWSGEAYNKAATKATTITASWNKMHTITFSSVNGDLHGTFPDGSSEPVSIKIENGKRIAVQGFERPTTFTNASGKYNFVGWAFAESPTTALVADGLDNLPLATRDTTLLAVWTTAPVYTVSFYANGSTTASYVSTVYQNDKATALTVDKMDPHPGYTFNGWFESGASTSFDFDQDITADVNLYAQWEKNSYTVNYELNCSNECANSNAGEFTVDGMTLSNPTWDEAHRFLGWYADAEFKDKKTSIPAGLTEGITLYAEWEEISYDITYRAGANGIGLVPSEKKIHGQPYTLRGASYTRNGYLQSGWVSEEGLTYAFGDEYSANASLIVYPTWDIVTYTITYVCDGCTHGNETSYTIIDKVNLSFPNVREGYSFGGWYTKADYSGNPVNVINKGAFGDTTFYGKWLKEYTITYVGTDNSYGDKTYTSDKGAQLRTAAPRAGYIFGGWFTNAEFEGDAVTQIVAGASGDTTFYAKWIPEVETVQYGAITVYTYASDGHKEAVIDGSSIETIDIPDGFDVTSVVYDRTFAAGKHSTIVLPFDIDVSNVSGATFYGLSGVTKQDGKWKDVQVYEITSGTLSANTPYIVTTTGSTITFSGSVTFASTQTLNPSVVDNGDGTRWEFKPSYEKIVFGDLPEIGRAYGFAAEDKDGAKIGNFVKAGPLAWMRPMRAYLVYEGNSGMTKSAVGSGFETELPDEINVVVQDEQGNVVERGVLNTRTGEIRMDSWYDLQGRKLNRKPQTQGTYYHNGSRVIVK